MWSIDVVIELASGRPLRCAIRFPSWLVAGVIDIVRVVLVVGDNDMISNDLAVYNAIPQKIRCDCTGLIPSDRRDQNASARTRVNQQARE